MGSRAIPIPAGATIGAPGASPALTPGERTRAVLRSDPAAAARVAQMLRENRQGPETGAQQLGLHGPLGAAENFFQGAGLQAVRNLVSFPALAASAGEYSGNPLVHGAGEIGAALHRIYGPATAPLPGTSERAGRILGDVLPLAVGPEGGIAGAVGREGIGGLARAAALAGAGGIGVGAALRAAGAPANVQALGELVGGGAPALFAPVLAADVLTADADALGRRAARGAERLLGAIRPGPGEPEMREELRALLPDLRAFARTRPLRTVETKLATRRAGEGLNDAAAAIWEREHQPMLERHAQLPVNLDPVAERIEEAVTPGIAKEFPQDAQRMLRRADEYRGRVEPLEDVESRRAARRRFETDSKFPDQPTAEKDLSRAITSGLVQRIEDTLQAAGEPGVREINMRTGRLAKIGDALIRRANAAEGERSRGDRILANAHLFGAGHGIGRTPYIGAFVRPIGMLRAAFTPESTNELVQAALEDLAAPQRESLAARLGRVLAPRRPGPAPAVPDLFGAPQRTLPEIIPEARRLPAPNPRRGGAIVTGSPAPSPPPAGILAGIPERRFVITEHGPLQTPVRPPAAPRGLLLPENPLGNILLPGGVVTETPVRFSNVEIPREGARVPTETELRQRIGGEPPAVEAQRGELGKPRVTRGPQGKLRVKRPGPGASLPGDVHVFTPEENELLEALNALLNATPESVLPPIEPFGYPSYDIGNVSGGLADIPGSGLSPEEAEAEAAEARQHAAYRESVQRAMERERAGLPPEEPIRAPERIKDRAKGPNYVSPRRR